MRYSFTNDEKNLLYFFLFAIFVGAGLSMADSPASELVRTSGRMHPPSKFPDERAGRRAGTRRKRTVSTPLRGGTGILGSQKADKVEGKGGELREPLAEGNVPLDINTATEGAISTLPGIGPVRAAAIVRTRTASGRFGTLDDLLKVRGIGKKILSGLEGYILLPRGGSSSEQATKPSGPARSLIVEEGRQANPVNGGAGNGLPSFGGENDTGVRLRGSGRRRDTVLKRMDVNSATREELEKVKGIGPVLAERIVSHRNRRGPFGNLSELSRIKGIKRHKAADLRKVLFVAGASPGTKEGPNGGTGAVLAGFESPSKGSGPGRFAGSGVSGAGQAVSSDPQKAKFARTARPWLDGYRMIPRVWPDLFR